MKYDTSHKKNVNNYKKNSQIFEIKYDDYDNILYNIKNKKINNKNI